MKTVKNYDDFSEEYRLNENLFKKAWDKIFSFFQKKFKIAPWLYYGLWLQKTDQLPKDPKGRPAIVIYSPNVDMDEIPNNKDLDIKTESLEDLRFDIQMINEDVVSLTHTDPNVRNIGAGELKEKIEDIYLMNLERVKEGEERGKTNALFIWGAPGIGKTEILQQVAKKLGIETIEFHLATIEPTDFRGVPKVEMMPGGTGPEDERTVSKIPAIFPTNNGPSGGGGIMFFDELNRAKQMVLSAALPLALNGKIGDYKLPSKWIIVAAGNRPEDLGGAVATALEPALANRFKHVNYAARLEDWIDWAVKKPGINPDLIGFLQFNKQYFHKLDPDKETPNWPSPRTWQQASEEEYYKREKDWRNQLPLAKTKDIYQDWVGAEAAIAFTEYLKLKEVYSEKNIRDVYEKGKAAKKPPTRLDVARAVSSAIAFYKKGSSLTEKELKNVLEWAIDLPDMEGKTSMLSYFKIAHPEVKTDPKLQPIWWQYVKLWHGELKELEKE